MGKNIVQKILGTHLVSGKIKAGSEIGISIDHTLTQDATGTMANLQFEAMGIPRVKTKLSVSYVDHNTLQTGFESMDDHLYLQTVAAKYGIYFSRPGNGICHQVNLERFSAPGEVLLGSDSHTTTCGGVGMLAIGAGGLDVAVAMAGGPFYLTMPQIVRVNLKGALQPWITAKDIILEMLRRLTVKGGVGKIFEYGGDGVESLTVYERATITNMGAELGATTSIFPSDTTTRKFLKMQGREDVWKRVKADKTAKYDEEMEIDLAVLEPLVAKPSSPDNVCKVKEIAGLKVDQVCIGSCTNSSYHDLMTAATVLKGKSVPPHLSLTISPGSKQVYETVAKASGVTSLILAGARMLESACGPCIGMGQSPGTGVVSVRGFNRNFDGRSGTKGDTVYLVSPETAAATALKGVLTDPRDLGEPPKIPPLKKIEINDNQIIPPPPDGESVQVVRGPNIKELPKRGPLSDTLSGEVLIKVGDNISTDHIMPAGAKLLTLRSNIPAMSEYVFVNLDPDFVKRTKEKGGGILLGGKNYGQGSSREHAALAPMYLGITAVIAKSFARIHRANLINFGILPLTLKTESDYEAIEQGDSLEIPDVKKAITTSATVTIKNTTKDTQINATHDLTPRQTQILLAGGLLNYTRQS